MQDDRQHPGGMPAARDLHSPQELDSAGVGMLVGRTSDAQPHAHARRSGPCGKTRSTAPGVGMAPGLLMCVLLMGAWCGAGEPIPADKRIAARVVRTIAAPEGQAMHMPTDVAVDSKGRVFVADGANDRVLRFSADGKLEETIAEVGSRKLSRPVGVSVDSKDQLWIADTGNHAIHALNADGKEVLSLCPLQVDTVGPADPTAIAVTADGKRTYVVDNGHHRILARDNTTRKWIALGENGAAIGQFQYPFMLCIGTENCVYVTEAIGRACSG